MRKLLKLLNDSRIYGPILLLLIFEGFMQSGLYSFLLRPDSYAFNVNRVRKIVLKSKVIPNLLVVGTSVPYQGLHLPLMNQLLQKEGIVVQSAATEGAMIETQYALSRDLLGKLPRVSTILLVADMAIAWKNRYKIGVVNRSMVAQFPRLDSFQILKEMEYRLKPSDYTFFLVRSLTYQADLRNFVLNPLYRIKKINRERRVKSPLYPHVNNVSYSLEGLGIHNLQDCIAQASRAQLKIGKKGFIRDETGRIISNKHHQRAAIHTCHQAGAEMRYDFEKDAKWQRLYFRRLKVLFDFYNLMNKKVIILFPPYSNIVKGFSSKKKMLLWKRNLDQICSIKKGMCSIIDSRESLDGLRNLENYYDVIHLNNKGSKKWSTLVSIELKKHRDSIVGSFVGQ